MKRARMAQCPRRGREWRAAGVTGSWSRLHPGQLCLWTGVTQEDRWAERVPAGWECVWAAQRQILCRTRPDTKGRHTRRHTLSLITEEPSCLPEKPQCSSTPPDTYQMKSGRVHFHKLWFVPRSSIPACSPEHLDTPRGLDRELRLVVATAEHWYTGWAEHHE